MMDLARSCMIVIWLLHHITSTSQYGDESGREFVLVFPVLTGTRQDGNIYLYVKGTNNGEVLVRASGMTTLSRTVTSLAQQITVPSTMYYTNLGQTEQKGVQVTATKDVTLYVMRGDEEGYMVLPRGFWSTDYRVVSYTPVVDGYSYFAFAAYQSGTAVEITFKTEDLWTCIGYQPVSGQTVTISLNQQEVWGLYCRNDLTGTLLQSNQPISVISGAIIPWTDATTTLYDFIEEMLFPIKSHGRHFSLPSVPDQTTIFRVTASVNNTVLDAEGWIHTHLGAGQYYDVKTTNFDLCFKSNHPIQIMIMGIEADSSPSSADGVLGDAYMVTVPPIESFQKSYDIEVFHTPGNKTHLLFVLESVYKEDMRASLPWTSGSYWRTSSCCDYATLHLDDNPSSLLQITKNYSFGVVQIGTNFGGGFGFMVGTSYGPPVCRSSHESLNATKLCVREYTTPTSWEEASDACAQHRSRLVKLDSDNKITEVKEHFYDQLDTQSFWIGLTQTGSSDYHWTDGEVLTNSDWGLPSTTGTCVYLGNLTTAGWFKQICSGANGYICENFVAKSGDIDMFPGYCIDTHSQCGANYTYLGQSSMCVRVSDTPRSWTEAAADCLSTGDRLVLLADETSMSVLETFMKNSWPNYHIGVFYHNLTWVSLNCAPLTYTNWGVGQPGAGEVCVSSVDGAWQTGSCDTPLPYACEKDTDGTAEPFVLGPSCGDPMSSSLPPSSSSSLDGFTSSMSFPATDHISSSSLYASGDSSFMLETSSVMLETSSVMLETSSVMMETSSVMLETSSVMLAASSFLLEASSSLLEASPTLLKTSTANSNQGSPTSLRDVSNSMTFSITLQDDIQSSSPNFETVATEFMDISSADSIQLYYTSAVVSTQAKHSSTSPTPSNSLLNLISAPRPELSTSEVCRCACLAATRLTNLSPSAVSAKDKQIKDELLLNTRNLTKYIMKYISMKDDRPSASGVGSLGVLLIVFTAVVIFGSDIINILNAKKKKETGSKKKQHKQI